MTYGITINSNNIIVGTLESSGTLPSGWIAITETQYPSAQVPGASWDAATSTVNPPAANYNLNAVAAQQIKILEAAAQSALPDPVLFTNAAGVATSYANTIQNQHNLAGALSAWTSADWPSNFFIYDINNVPVVLTFADAQGLAKAFANAFLTVYTNLNNAIAQVNNYVANGGTVAEIQGVTL